MDSKKEMWEELNSGMNKCEERKERKTVVVKRIKD
jgi:hypothetical protein